MDPFSVSIAAIGITGTAVNSISSLRDTIAGLKDAQKDVDDIRVQLDNIRSPLETLQSLVSDTDEEMSLVSKQVFAKTRTADAVNECGKACETFQKKLLKWTKHSDNDKLSLRDQISVGLWNRERVRTFRTRVETCQRMVHFAMSSTQLILQERSTRDSSGHELLQQKMEILEAQTQDILAVVRQQQEEASARRQLLYQSIGDDDDDEMEGQRTLAIEEMDKQYRIQDETQVSLGVVFAQLRAGRTHQEIGNVITDEGSMALIGLPERLVGRMDQRIGDVSTTNRSAALVGVFDQGVDIKDFFKRESSTSESSSD